MSIKLTPEELAKLAYGAYKETMDKNDPGLPMPKFEDLPTKTKEAFAASASLICGFSIGYVLEKLSRGIREIETEIKEQYGLQNGELKH